MRATLFKSHKWGALAIGGVLLISLATPVNAAAPKAGATCTKKNATATSSGKLYTCILSGKKLVWNKGVAVKVSPSPTSKSEPINLLASDVRITSQGGLTALDICKTEDASPEYLADGTLAHHNGFPRPVQAFSGKKSAKVLVVPLSFNDLPFRDEKVQRGPIQTSDVDLLNEAIPATIARYKKLSYGKFDLKIDVLPKSKWIVLDTDNPFSGVWGVNNMPKLVDILDNQKLNFDFEGYDSFIFVGGNGTPGQVNWGSAQATFAEKVKKSKSGYISAVLMVGRIDNYGIWVHELGHSLFSLEDLYLYSQAASGQQREKAGELSIPVKWDLMAEAPKETYLQWNRFLMGWLDDSEILSKLIVLNY
jgi:M6 family metalloprotease-like protein